MSAARLADEAAAEDGAAVDLYTPWREGSDALGRRHVGRGDELDAIRSAARAFAAGASPLPVYLFGPSGAGKSHLLTLAEAAARAVTPAADVAVTVVPEDSIEMRSAVDLFALVRAGADPVSWTRWRGEPAPAEPDARRRVVLFEGLDRQLRALGVQGRRELRRLLGDGPPIWIVGAGMTLPDELTAADEAFFGAFDPWPLEGLQTEEAGVLVDRVAGRNEHDGRWRPTRATLMTVAGGSPRTLVALGLACRAEPERPASEMLHRVVHDFTPQYRSKLRDLSPQAQRMVTLLSAAPRELGPSELATLGATSTTQMSVQARRLVDDGVLRHRSDGRQTWYRMADPLFRFWLEYRNARWSDTRTSWLANLLPALSRPVAASALGEPLPKRWGEVRTLLVAALVPLDRDRAREALARAAQLPASGPALRQLVDLALEHDLGDLVAAELGATVRGVPAELRDVRALVELDEALRSKSSAPREAFLVFAARLDGGGRPDIETVLVRLLARAPAGKPWGLRPGERRRLAAEPFVRAVFLCQGRRWSHPPLILPEEVLEALGASSPPALPDAAGLLGAAVELRHAALARAVAPQVVELPPCHRPNAFDAETATTLAALIGRALAASQSGAVFKNALTWAATLAMLSDAQFDAALATFQSAARGRAHHDDYRHEMALAALLLRAPERFTRLERALSSSHGFAFRSARRLTEQIAEAKNGALHPELAIVADAVGAPA